MTSKHIGSAFSDFLEGRGAAKGGGDRGEARSGLAP